MKGTEVSRIRVLLVCGGQSSEHQISCVSAAGILNAIDLERFEPIVVGITREGQWIIPDSSLSSANLSGDELPSIEAHDNSPRVLISMDGTNAPCAVRYSDGRTETLGPIDVVFPVLHGKFGEDGTIQGFFAMLGLPVVGCGVLSSALCMDKYFTRQILHVANLPVVPSIEIDLPAICNGHVLTEPLHAHSLIEHVHAAQLDFPLFVKPSRSGSSFGVGCVEDSGDMNDTVQRLWQAVEHAAQYDSRILIEQAIDGREIECAVLQKTTNHEPLASLPGEIVLNHKSESSDTFYDFDSKYRDPSASLVQVPANLPQDVQQRVQDLAKQAFMAVNANGLSRVDFFYMPDGALYINEINTMPGFTPISMYAQAWGASGIDYRSLVSALIDEALEQDVVAS